MEIIAWVGFSQSLFAAILMFAKKGQGVSDKILSAWLSLLAFEFLSCAIDYQVYGAPLLSSSFILFNPAFYLYSKTLIGNAMFRLKPLQLLHLFPFVFFETTSYVLKQPYTLYSFFTSDSSLWFRYFFAIASVVSWLAYNWATLHLIIRHRRSLKHEFSTIESNAKVSWLIFIVFFYNLLCLAAIAISVSAILLKLHFPISPVYNYSNLLLMAYILGFYGLRQKRIYPKPIDDEPTDERYASSILSDEKKNEIREKLLDYFAKKRPYLNPEFNMSMLSEAIDVPKYQVTEVLNVNLGKNFFRLVNEYRVEAVKKMLLKKKEYSIEAIGYECGFNSKSTFFTVFKNITGLTPLQFKLAMEQNELIRK
jgi:AraC-like DNA-binding protein